VAERDLAAVADQDVQADGGDGQDQERDDQRPEHVVAGDERHQQEGKRHHAPDEKAVLRDRQQLLVRPVGGLELAVFA